MKIPRLSLWKACAIEDPAGQRFHFMRAETETDATAFNNASAFIKQHTENWVMRAKKVLQYNPRPLANANRYRSPVRPQL